MQALPLLGSDPFLVVSGDIYTEYPYGRALSIAAQIDPERRPAWCVVTDNPDHHERGDFALAGAMLHDDREPRLNFGNIGVYHPAMFAGIAAGSRVALGPMLFELARNNRLAGEYFAGRWVNLGTPQQVTELDALLRVS